MGRARAPSHDASLARYALEQTDGCAERAPSSVRPNSTGGLNWGTLYRQQDGHYQRDQGTVARLLTPAVRLKLVARSPTTFHRG